MTFPLKRVLWAKYLNSYLSILPLRILLVITLLCSENTTQSLVSPHFAKAVN